MTNINKLKKSYQEEGLTSDLVTKLVDLYHTDSNTVVNSFLILEAYNMYKYLFILDELTKKHSKKPAPVYKTARQSDYLASSLFKSAIDLSSTLLGQKQPVNPVYYLSTIFENRQFNYRNKKVLMKIPNSSDLINNQSIFITKQNYDSTYFAHMNSRPHQTICFVDTFVPLSYINSFFNLEIQGKSVSDSLYKEYVRVLSENTVKALVKRSNYTRKDELLDSIQQHLITIDNDTEQLILNSLIGFSPLASFSTNVRLDPQLLYPFLQDNLSRENTKKLLELYLGKNYTCSNGINKGIEEDIENRVNDSFYLSSVKAILNLQDSLLTLRSPEYVLNLTEDVLSDLISKPVETTRIDVKPDRGYIIDI